MKRRLFNLAAAVSLVLLVTVGVAWVRSYTGESYQWHYYVRRANGGSGLQLTERSRIVSLSAGYVYLRASWADVPARNPSGDPPDDGWTFRHTRWTPRPPPAAPPPPGSLPGSEFVTHRRWAGWGIYAVASELRPRLPDLRRRLNLMYGTHSREIDIPLWMPTVLTAIFPLYLGSQAWLRSPSRRRAAAGRCPACGYDLRATPQRCPECGRVPEANAQTVA